jgi:hydroxypyruvate isomerase
MNRRDFASILGASLLVPSLSKGSSKAREKPFEMNYAPHFGMFKNHAGTNELDQLQFMYDQGFTALEDNELMGRPVALQEKIGEKLAKLNMKMGVFVIKFDGFFDKQTMTTGKKEWTDLFLDSCRKAVDTSKRVNAKWATVVPGNFTRDLPIGIQTGHVIDNLKRAAEILEPAGLTMVLEPLSDNSDLFLRYSDQTYSICRAVGSPSCKILFDMYHMQRNEGNLIANMDKCWDEIAYLQIGDNPGRKEPTTGEVNYQTIFRHLKQKEFTGVLGMEHGNSMPGKEGEIALIEAYRKSDV